MPTNTDRVLDFIQAFPGGDDDEIARVLGISPRQQVNQICRRLARQGRIRRAVAGAGKLANFPVTGPALPPARPARQTTLEADNEGELQADGASKPPLTDLLLVEGGLAKTAKRSLSSAGVLATDEDLPSGPGVYAFVREGLAHSSGWPRWGCAADCAFTPGRGRHSAPASASTRSCCKSLRWAATSRYTRLARQT